MPTRTRSPACTPALRIVEAPSTICLGPRGIWPSTVEIRAAPRRARSATARTGPPLTSISGRLARVILAIAWSCRRLVRSRPVSTAPDPRLSLANWALKRRAVECGRRDEPGQARSEDRRRAQRGQRKHAAEQRGADRDGPPAASALERVPDPDHGRGRCACPHDRPDGKSGEERQPGRPAAQPRVADGGPDRENHGDEHGGDRPERGDRRVEHDRTRRAVRQPRFSDRSQRRQGCCSATAPAAPAIPMTAARSRPIATN